MKLYLSHPGYIILLVLLAMSGDLKPTWRGLTVALLFDIGRFLYHQITFKMKSEEAKHERRSV